MFRDPILDEIRRLQEYMNRLVKQAFSSLDVPQLYSPDYIPTEQSNIPVPSFTSFIDQGYRLPLVHFQETDKEIIARIELPGVDKNDIQLNVKGQGLEIKVEKKKEIEKKDKKKGVYQYHGAYLGFYRYIPLPDYADTNNIIAKYKNGVLEVTILKKRSAKKKVKKIKIN